MKTHKIKLLHFFCDDVLSGEKCKTVHVRNLDKGRENCNWRDLENARITTVKNRRKKYE